MILDGRRVARSIYETLAADISVLGTAPGLAAILVWDSPASIAYIAQKRKYARRVGIDFEVFRLPESTSETQLLQTMDGINADDRFHGLIVQLPLPKHLSRERIIRAIAPEKDVDGFGVQSAGNLFFGTDGYMSCTPKGVMRLLEYYEKPVAGKRVAVLGQSDIVGKPMALALIAADATVLSCNALTHDSRELTLASDIVIIAIGVPGFLTRDRVRPGTTVIDVGYTRVDGRGVGDADFENLKDLCDITPVPGGVGAMTVAMLLENAYRAARESLRRGVRDGNVR